MTERQEEVLAYIRQYQQAEGVPPSTREVARKLGFSQPAASKHLQALAAQGRLRKLDDRMWGLSAAEVQDHFAFPVYGTIPAGLPAMQEQDPEEIIAIDPAVFGVRQPRPGYFWFLRVRGDSMIGANILDGDLVALVRREAKVGDIIAALVDETSTTLKRVVKVRGRTLLRAANPRFADIVPQRLESQGVVIGVIRRKLA
jgi:repressor LexA